MNWKQILGAVLLGGLLVTAVEAQGRGYGTGGGPTRVGQRYDPGSANRQTSYNEGYQEGRRAGFRDAKSDRSRDWRHAVARYERQNRNRGPNFISGFKDGYKDAYDKHARSGVVVPGRGAPGIVVPGRVGPGTVVTPRVRVITP